MMTIEEISVLAGREGVSYGRYVFEHAVETEAGGAKIVHIRPGEKRCAFCGRIFMPMNSRNRFCRDSCRIRWNSRRQRQIKAVEAAGDEAMCKRAV